jgi:hypothetical protein
MSTTGPEKSSCHLLWVERDGFAGWGCSICSWVFNPTVWPTGTSLNETIENSQEMLSGDFESHDCNNYYRSLAIKEGQVLKNQFPKKPDAS